MTNDESMTKLKLQNGMQRGGFDIRHLIIPSSLDIRHSSFILRHARHPFDSRETGLRP